ncbi:hypothetical protein [Rhodovulum marinum]|uniref:Uncharacterized protein n=1 Tax=Rhodovulum marinum TaxID=320662 RepID=A0A4R2PSL2_9RHOB|nr:hypothetical protein [Rhodovulum marinum]TCP38787.1 hypothetical protein EV662_11721 [Rhodovulum marinum]
MATISRTIFLNRRKALLCYPVGMDHKDYMHALRHKTPNHPYYEPEARSYPNASGVEELIFLPASTWAYADFLEANTDIRIADWVIEADELKRDDYTIAHILWFWLWENECDRFRNGLTTPHDMPPMGYEGWADEFHEKKG